VTHLFLQKELLFMSKKEPKKPLKTAKRALFRWQRRLLSLCPDDFLQCSGGVGALVSMI